ncbi:flavoprotein [Streptomyces sp. H10-C2]|uniref:flavoprotein n=1 Tax=unclassified Streptomyces TaxID=2593676 RepID=UPI0024BA09AA|nr:MULTISPECIES: flavoprotein [unclassified Streptomyces]MDJ0345552.1 flavoprotein [Streptomyces sp. PH10-H1]MDJ0374498.1 flavoprotein [Streptomyces sp. H10-C2]
MTTPRTLYLIACAAPPARRIATGIRAAQSTGWDVCLILTPSAHRWAEEEDPGELDELRELTGHPVRHRYKLPSESDILPAPDALLVAPLTFNTTNKWAGGHADTLALGLLTEGLGLNLPIVALPYLNNAQAAHPVFDLSVEFLRAQGVRVLLGGDGFTPHPPKHGNLDAYPWASAMAALPAESAN